MKKYLPILTLALVMLSIPSKSVYGQSLFIWGNVKWATGYPAVGVEVRLVKKNEMVMSKVYTDQSGSYAFFGIRGRPSDHYVKVYSRGNLLANRKLEQVPIGGHVPEIRLFSKVLRMTAVALPKTVAKGQKTVIIVTVKDENGRPLPNVRTTIFAGGGKFLRAGESYNPKSRLQGPYKATGKTDSRGIYQASWVCNPCSRGYGLRVEGDKDGFITSTFDLMVNIR